MKPTIFTSYAVRWFRISLGSCFLSVVFLTVAYSQPLQFPIEKKKDEPIFQAMPKDGAPSAVTKLPVEAGAVEVAFTDGSNLKMLLREEKITLATPHGKLHIAVADIQRIEFATRVSDEDTKQIKSALADLGSAEFDKREAASTQLRKFREKAYPALQRAAGQNDPEVARRARELIQHISSSVPADRLVVRPNDVVYTADSMIAGRVEGVSLKAHTSQFGSVQVKLTDVRSLHIQGLQTTLPLPSPRAMGNDPVQQQQMERERVVRQLIEMQRRQMQMKAK